MSAAPKLRQKVVLRVAPSRLDRLCEQIVTQLALHVLLNKSRICQGTAKSGEVEIALRRLEGLGVVCSLDLQVDYNITSYYFLRRYSDIVGQIFKRRVEIIKEYQAQVKTQHAETGVGIGQVVQYQQGNSAQRSDDELAYIEFADYMRRELA